MTSSAKLNWQCRRGTAELDRLLLQYLQNSYAHTNINEQQCFERLLEFEDADLIGFLLSPRLPEEPQLAALVEKIRSGTIICAE